MSRKLLIINNYNTREMIYPRSYYTELNQLSANMVYHQEIYFATGQMHYHFNIK